MRTLAKITYGVAIAAALLVVAPAVALFLLCAAAIEAFKWVERHARFGGDKKAYERASWPAF